MKTWISRAVIAAALAAPAAAQQAPPPAGAAATEAEGVKAYDPAFFARYNPVTAYDMVRQVPGFIINNGESLRGFGATAGNVLIDGQRPSSKNSISDELARISARDVARIEIIGAAAAGDIDVRGYTELANVVLKPATGTQVSTTWNGDLIWQGERVGVRAGATRSWKTDDVTSRLNVQAYNRGQRAETDITTRNASDVVTSTRDEFNQQVLSELLINGTVNWAASPRDTVNLNGRLMGRLFTSNTGSSAYNPAGTLTQVVADAYTEKDILYADLGGDWEHKFSPQNSVKLILINRLVNWRPQELFEQFNPSGFRPLAQEINTDLKSGEHVARGVWTIKPGDAHTIEFGIEGAFNYRDQQRTRSTSIDEAGFVLDPPRALDTVRTEEVRGEASITDTWRIDPKLTLELGFNYEASKITQSSTEERESEFTYPKPRAILTWLPTDKDQLRLAVERVVAQLDFSEFASSLSLTQNIETSGNPNLEPAQTWETSLQWKRPIGQRGSISITGYYYDIEDVQDFIPVWPDPACPPPTTTCVSTAAGNIGDGKRWGFNLEAAFPLDGFIKGGILKVTGGARDSRVTDPVTGEERRISSDLDYNWNVDFRQDLPEMKLAWGGDYTGSGESDVFRLNEQQTRGAGEGDLDLFIETTYFKGMTLRFAADNIGDMPSQTERRFFTPNRFPGGVFSGSEYREQTQGPIFAITVTGSL